MQCNGFGARIIASFASTTMHADSRQSLTGPIPYLPPNIPGIEGMPIRPPPAIFFIIFCISRN